MVGVHSEPETIRTSTLRDLPQDIEWVMTENDPFIVSPQRHWLLSLGIFISTLPLSVFSLCFLAFYGFIAKLLYPKLVGKRKDRLARQVSQLILMCCRLNLKTTDHSKGIHAKLYIGNHICMLEGVILISIVGHVRFLAASFSRDIPFVGALVRLVEPIFVDRKKGNAQYANQIKESLEKDSLRHVIFPEGAYENGSAVLRFKSGAFIAGKPVTPVLFSYPSYVPFWNRQESSLFTQIYRFLSRFQTTVNVDILPIYIPNEEEREKPTVYAENVRRYMSYYLKTDLSNLDVFDSPNYKIDVGQI